MHDAEDIVSIVKQIQDYLCPKLDSYEQMLYHYFFRHSHMEGSRECIVGLTSLRNKIGLGTGVPGNPPSEDQIRTKVRSIETKGFIKIVDRTREGTTIRVLLPAEVPGCIPTEKRKNEIDVEAIDFSIKPYRHCILLRESSKCFYCFRELKEGRYELDHVVPSSRNGNKTYRNLVAACLDCNNTKGDEAVESFLRSLFRRNLLSEEELQGRLQAVSELQEGKRVPPMLEAEA
jgi:5-methylcytosine-specific restriction endonuclease McrA